MTSQNFSFTSGEFFGDGDTAVFDDSYGTSGSNGVWRWDIIAGGTRYDTGSGWSIDYTHSTGVWRVKKPNEEEDDFRSQTADSNGVVTFPPDSGTLNLCVFTESSAFSSFPASGGGGGGGGFLSVDTPNGSLTYNGNVNYIIDAVSPSTSSTEYYGLQENGTFLGLTANSITHSNGTQTIGYVSGTVGSVYRLMHTDTSSGTTVTTELASLTVVASKKVSCNFW